MMAEYAFNLYCKDAKFIDLQKIENEMILNKKIEVDKTCHFEIWKR